MLKKLVILILTFTLIFPFVVHTSVYASGNAFYIDSVNGDNNNAGTQDAPWKDFTNVNSRVFQPGDQILLKRDCTWTASMTLQGSGTSGSYITVRAYGTGAAPKIYGTGTGFTAITLSDASYWSFENLQFYDFDVAILCQYSAAVNLQQGLRFYNIYGENPDNNAPYRLIKVYVPDGGSSDPSIYTVRDIIVDSCYAKRATGALFDGGVWDRTTNSFKYIRPWVIQDVTVKNSTVELTGAAGAFGFQGVKNVLFMDNDTHNNCNLYKSSGNTQNFICVAQDVKCINNSLTTTVDTNSNDMTAVDNEGWDDSSVFRGNYVAGNAGAGLEFLALVGRTGDYNINNVVDGNTFYNNGTDGGFYRGGIFFANNAGATADKFNGSASNNLYYDTYGLTKGTPGSGWTFSNNLLVNPGDMFNSSNGFSDTQGTNGWNYKYFDGSSWQNLTYDSTTSQWGDSANGYVSEFNTTPGSNTGNWTARTWKAPKDGVVDIRGWVLKNQLAGDGAKIRISKNSTKIWPVDSDYYTLDANDQTGVSTNLDAISVAANDEITFEVNCNADNTNDKISWNPTIGYKLLYEECESLPATAYGATETNFSDVNCSGGAGNKLNSTGINQYVEYSIILPTSGTYDIKVKVKKQSTRGMFKLYLPQASAYVGTEQDQYASTDQYVELDFGNYTFNSSGTKNFRFIVTGKNPSSTGYTLGFDYIKLTKQ